MKPTMHRHIQQSQQGVVLIVVMIMLVIIGLSSAAVMRNALEADLISANVRSEHIATEAAQAALAFCEQQVINQVITPRAVRVADDHKAHWEDLSQWLVAEPSATDGPFTPPSWPTADPTRDSGSAAKVIGAGMPAPQCIAEFVTINATNVVRVTARGFTPDYSIDPDTSQPASGSAVWLQSTIQLANTTL